MVLLAPGIGEIIGGQPARGPKTAPVPGPRSILKGCSGDAPLDLRAALGYGRRENDNCRRDLRRDAYEQRRLATTGMLQLGKQSWPEREAELIDRDDEADDPGEMLLRELLLDDEARQRGRIPHSCSEQQTT
jgi:hypothetical protein